MLKRMVKALMNMFGLEISRKRKPVQRIEKNGMAQGLGRFKALNIPVGTIIDVGAAAGTWSLRTYNIWTQSSFVLFEPLHERKDELETLVRKYPAFYFVPCAAGSESSSVQFRIAEDLDGSGVAGKSERNADVRSVQVTRIDTEIARLGLTGPYFIKLDTHGFEMPILEGCAEIMQDVVLFIVECYGFRITDNSLLFWEMCREMERRGFRLFDMVDVMHRPKDNAFWQCDAFFIRKEHALFSHNEYR